MFKSRLSYLVYPIILVLGFSYFPQKNIPIQEIEDLQQLTSKNEEAIEPYCESFNKTYFQNQDFRYIKNLEIKILNSQGWNQNLFEAFVYEGEIIKDQFKKKFESKIKFNFSDESFCEFNGMIRINGDWKDHLKIKNGTMISSLDIRLNKGNIFGITEFKLFIPETRKSDNEIFIASLFSELGFISPRTFYIDAQVNETINQKYIFQEKFRKEMVEFNGYKEGPLIQVNDKTRWEDNETMIFDSEARPIYFGYINNETWLERSKENIIIGNNALYGFNEIINLIENSLYYPSIKNIKEVASFDAAIFASYSNHAYELINRKFLYDPLNQHYLPVYYDGDSEVLNENNLFELTRDKANNLLAIGARSLLNEKQVDANQFTKILNNRGLFLDLEDVNYYLNRFYKNLEQISKISDVNLDQSIEIMESNKKYNNIFEYIEATYSIFENFITIEDSNLNFKICNDKLVDCDNFFSISEFIDTDRSINDYKFIPSDKINTENISKVTLYEGIAIININNTDIKIDEDSKKIELNFYAPKQRIVIQGEQQNDAILDNWSVTAISTDIFSVPNNDIFGLTGCVNFINVELKNINITTKNLSCEDSVNIIKSSGEIENIFVNDSFSDGLDIDFSQIDIHNVKIINSGNDCLDLSYGIYKFNSVLSENCADKGVSIGEASFVELKNLEINNSKTGLVVKDSSNVLVGNLEVKNSETCFSFYRKKQEFIQPIIEFKNYFCDEEINFIQSGVEFEN